jgi:hypothetical protein
MTNTSKILDVSVYGYETALEGLCTDMSVAGLIIPSAMDDQEVSDLCETDGKGTVEAVSFQDISMKIADYFKAVGRFTVRELGLFSGEHPWHIFASTSDVPTVRTWTHIRGEVRLFLARSKDERSTDGFYGASDQEVLAHTVAAPILIIPKPGDMVIFVDRNMPGKTGHPTFHKTG